MKSQIEHGNTGNESFLLVNIKGAPTCFMLSYLETDILLISPQMQILQIFNC